MDSNELSWGQQLDKELREKVWEGPGLDVLSRDSQGRVLSYKLTHDQLRLLSRTFEKLRYGFQMWRRNDSESTVNCISVPSGCLIVISQSLLDIQNMSILIGLRLLLAILNCVP